MWRPTSCRITSWVTIWLRILALKSSYETPCSWAAFSRSSMVCQVVLLADLVEPVDQFGLAGDAQFLAFGEPELLVDQVAQQVLVLFGNLLHGQAALPAFVVQFLQGAVVVGPGNDLVVDARNDVFDHRSAVGAFGSAPGGFAPARTRQEGWCRQRTSEETRKKRKVIGWRTERQGQGTRERGTRLRAACFHRRHCKCRESRGQEPGTADREQGQGRHQEL